MPNMNIIILFNKLYVLFNKIHILFHCQNWLYYSPHLNTLHEASFSIKCIDLVRVTEFIKIKNNLGIIVISSLQRQSVVC